MSTSEAQRSRKKSIMSVVENGKLSFSNIKKWTILRFGIIFVLAILVLCVIYGLKSTNHKQVSTNVVDFAFAVGDKLYAENLWLVVEIESNDRGLRTAQGKAISAHVCSAIKASQAVGWTPLVVGGKSSCCRSSECRYLHPLDLKQLNLLTTKYFLHKFDYSSAMKVGAFLAAIKLGAVVIFHAHPENYYNSGVPPDQYQKQLEYQLRKLTLGVSVGLVKGKEPKVASFLNPYQHFVPSLGNMTDLDSHRFKICEKEPPSMEKFLDNDGFSMDQSAPSLTLPGKISSPFDTRNTAFARSAFWSLLVLPDIGAVRSPRELNEKAIYIFRSIMAQTILAAIGGSTEFSVSQVATVDNVLMESLPKDLQTVATFLDAWKCRSKTATGCLKDLSLELLRKGVLSESNVEVMDFWITDLLGNNYEDVPTVKKSADPLYPCIEQDALVGVYFIPTVITNISEQSSATEKAANDHAIKVVQQLCPSVGASYISKALSSNSNKHEDLVLIIAFTDKRYQNLPLFEALYRHHFKNILYCGEPDKVIDEYREQYTKKRGTFFSFLPAHRQPGYECLLGALEMGYNVEGFLVVDEKTLINPWNFKDFDPDSIWHGNNDIHSINHQTVQNKTENTPVIAQSTVNILKALQFLENVLLKPSNLQATLEKVTRGRGRGGSTRKRRDTEEEETQNVTEENRKSSQAPEFSISVFGELNKEDENDNRTILSTDSKTPDKDVSELLLDPANFHEVDEYENGLPNLGSTTKHPANVNLTKVLGDIDRLSKHINEKLNLWLKIVTSSDIVSPEDLAAVQDVQCDSTSNQEICKIVAVFFKILSGNQGSEFRLIYDDLPVYYVPSIHKEKLFILANLFTKFDIDEKMALPILLRGLSPTETWTKLEFAAMKEEIAENQLKDPKDLIYLHDGIDDDEEFKELEQAHYLYPVDIKSILTNEELKNIICRNYGA